MRASIRWGLTVVSAVVAAYVAYAHFVSFRHVSLALDEAQVMRFDRTDWARGLDVRSHGLEVTSDGAALRVRAKAPEVGAALEVRGAARSLREAEVRLRFRLEARADVDVAVGVASDEASVAFGAHDGTERASWRFFGDTAALPPRRPIDDEQRFVPLLEGGEHVVALRVSPDLHAVLGAVDGVPVSSHLAFWDLGAKVRPFLFVRSRGDRPVDVAILGCDWVPIEPDVKPRGFDERFDGRVLDPVRWRVLRSDGWDADGSFELGGGGVTLRGRGLRPTRTALAFGLVGPTFPLGSFRARVAFELESLHRSRLYVAVANPLFGLPDWRTFETGLADGPTRIDPYVAGQWEGDQQFQVVSVPGAAAGGKSRELRIDYDASTGVARAFLDGRALASQRLDFQPPEEVRVELGVRVEDRDASFAIKVTRFQLEPLPWRASGELDAHAAPSPDGGVHATPFFDDFASGSLGGDYRVLSGIVQPSAGEVHLGVEGEGPVDSEVVRGFFDGPVAVSASILASPERGAADVAGVMAVDRSADSRIYAWLAYGKGERSELRIERRSSRGVERLATAELPIEIGRRYWLKMLVDRRNVYARAWLASPGAAEPSEWGAGAPIEEGWTAAGGVGLAAIGVQTSATWLRAE